MSAPRTLYDKIFDDHVVDRQDDGTCLLYIDRHLVHEVTSPQAFEGLRMTGRKVRHPEKTLAVVDHNVPTSPDRKLGIKNEESRIQVEALAKNAARFRRRILFRERPPPGHRPHHRPRAGLHPARHDHRLRRQPHLHARRLRRAGARHRHVRGRACARHPDADPAKAKNMLVRVDGQLPDRRHRQGHHPRHHRRDRHRRRHRLRHRICRRGDPRAVDGRPHDGLQHVDRGRRPRRPDRARRDHLRLCQGQAARARRARPGTWRWPIGRR